MHLQKSLACHSSGIGGTGVQVLHHGSQTFWKKMNDVWYISSQSFYSILFTYNFSQEQKDSSKSLAK